MKELFTEIAEEFKLYWKSYIFQSFLATLTTFLVLLVLSVKHAVIVASIGSTAFIIFVTPEKKIARARNVIGGHLIELITGSLCALIPHPLFLHSIVIYSLAHEASTRIRHGFGSCNFGFLFRCNNYRNGKYYNSVIGSLFFKTISKRFKIVIFL